MMGDEWMDGRWMMNDEKWGGDKENRTKSDVLRTTLRYCG